jgi:acyl-CoA thioesterase
MNPTENTPMTPEQLAKATAQKMYESDACSRALGLELAEVRPGYARMQ